MEKESCSEINSVSCLNTPPGAGRQECHSHYSPVVPVAGTTAATQLTFRLKRAACADTPPIKQFFIWEESPLISPHLLQPVLLQDSWLKGIVSFSVFLISVLTARRDRHFPFSVQKWIHAVHLSELKGFASLLYTVESPKVINWDN